MTDRQRVWVVEQVFRGGWVAVKAFTDKLDALDYRAWLAEDLIERAVATALADKTPP